MQHLKQFLQSDVLLLYFHPILGSAFEVFARKRNKKIDRETQQKQHKKDRLNNEICYFN